MEFTELIAKRRSVRRYAPGDIPLSDIEALVDAARMAPSAKNLRQMHFIAVKNRALIREIGDAIAEENERICRILAATDARRAEAFRADMRECALFLLDAPLLLAVMARPYAPEWYGAADLVGEDGARRIVEKSPDMQSLGAALAHLALRATELGYGACQITSANYADKNVAALLRARAGFDKPGYALTAFVSVGVPAEESPAPPRKPLPAILTVIE
ncbi:MAG: nitroreductase family protein [Clostridiales Family XIII bacterium]|jgi:nitroreductase|nr:nitroreductase family protein [Clostridiales Family XIII bacterium]